MQTRAKNKKQLLHYLSTNSYLKEQFSTTAYLGTDQVPLFIKKLYNDRNRQYHLIGNDWLIKFSNGDFLDALSYLIRKGKLTVKQKREITNGIVELNKLIGLVQNGHVIQSDGSGKSKLKTNVGITVKGKKITIYYSS